MGLDAPWHWIILAVIVIALFGYKKMPDAARSLGRSLRIFKTEIKGMAEDDKARDAATATPIAPTAVQPPVAPVVPAAPVVAESPVVDAPAPTATVASNGGQPTGGV